MTIVDRMKMAPQKFVRVLAVAWISAINPSLTTALAADPPAAATATDADSLPVQLIPEQEAVMSSLMTAKIISIPFKLGDSFDAGAVLAEFDCQELIAKRDSSVAELKAAEETHISKLRLQALGAAGALEVTLAASAVERMQANVRLNLAQLLNCQLVAPFPGKITRLRLREQEIVAANQPVLDIVDNRSLKIQLYVPPKLGRSVSVGSPMVIRINDVSKEVLAKVTRINPRIDGPSQVLELEAGLIEPPPGLKAGMLGNAEFVGGKLFNDKLIKAKQETQRIEKQKQDAELKLKLAAEAKLRQEKARQQAEEARALALAEKKAQAERAQAEERARADAEAERKRQEAEAERKRQAEEEARVLAEKKAQEERVQAEERARAEAEAERKRQKAEAERKRQEAETERKRQETEPETQSDNKLQEEPVIVHGPISTETLIERKLQDDEAAKPTDSSRISMTENAVRKSK